MGQATAKPESLLSPGRSEDLSWQRHAACAGHPDPDLWFPDKRLLSDGREAQRICWEECPVRVPCLAYARTHHIEHGIYGGYGPKGRQALPLQGSRAQPWPSRASVVNVDARAARHAFERAQVVGVTMTARELNVDVKTLYRAWDKFGLRSPGRPRSKLDAATARAARDRALRTSTRQVARELHVHTQTLYRAWRWYDIDRPALVGFREELA